MLPSVGQSGKIDIHKEVTPLSYEQVTAENKFTLTLKLVENDAICHAELSP